MMNFILFGIAVFLFSREGQKNISLFLRALWANRP